MNIYISIVSHGHDDMIMANKQLNEISLISNVHVAIKDNICSDKLRDYSINSGFDYLDCNPFSGFGKNNNLVFRFYVPEPNDWFLVINPDVLIDPIYFNLLIKRLSIESHSFFCVNLFKDEFYSEYEHSIRYFPTLSGLLGTVFCRQPLNKYYQKSLLSDGDCVEWASGAFLIFRSSLYSRLGGFDISYHMYYEDVDICYRARYEHNEMLHFIKEVFAIHDGAYQNRNIFSKHFRWYLISLARFLSRKLLCHY